MVLQRQAVLLQVQEVLIQLQRVRQCRHLVEILLIALHPKLNPHKLVRQQQVRVVGKAQTSGGVPLQFIKNSQKNREITLFTKQIAKNS